jgi:exoribonuclease R
VPERLAAHKLIEEFMIQANVAAAETLEKAKKQKLIYRIHDGLRWPSRNRCASSWTRSASLPQGAHMRPSQFNGILAGRGSDNAALVNEVVLRSQSQAEYVAEKYRPFRPEPAPLRAFHLADPPLCRSDRASRADRLARLRRMAG